MAEPSGPASRRGRTPPPGSPPQCPRFVLTGGPGFGKTTLMAQLRAEDPPAQRWVPVPEAAPLLFRAGLDGRQPCFQAAVARLQIALEAACAQASRPGQLLVCHRGTLDALAYWRRNGWAEQDFFAATATSREDHLHRYQGVIHLQTTAIGALAHYQRWPDAHRPETSAEAWHAHPGYVLITNGGRDWEAMARAARKQLDSWLDTDLEEARP